ncbi:Imm63 family immunity protein [Clostridium sp.]|uniref:Imm63 family immunity protein n=1 Tax=Clostridium sp. TaxID=1506 RepID=UPI00261B3A87|nr:Imm63 family immunity protein [Clostridium sp.]
MKEILIKKTLIKRDKLIFNYSDIQDMIFSYASKIGLHNSEVFLNTSASDYGYPYIEIKNNLYHLVVSERGKEVYRYTTKNIDELLYEFFSMKISTMSIKYELEHRVENQDSRRIIFSRRIYLMSAMNPEWGEKMKREVSYILSKNPYNDIVI